MEDRDAALESLIDGAAVVLAIKVEPEWRGAVKTNLEVSLAFWDNLRAFELPEDIEPAAVFDAFSEAGDP